MARQQTVEDEEIKVSELGNLAVTRLLKEYKMFKDDKDAANDILIRPMLVRGSDNKLCLHEWDIYMDGPPDTVFEGYVLRCRMSFPRKYPYIPPKFRFLTPMFHPNIYTNGNVCISILHTDNDDPTFSENKQFNWSPGQNVRTICVSVISILNEPNISSPANVDASVMYRDNPKEYERIVKMYLEKDKEDFPINK